MSMYAKEGGQPPVVDRIIKAVASDRPDMLTMGDNAAKYGIVMNGGTSAEALGVYSNMAENFTGYWNGAIDEDAAIANVEAYMKKAFGKNRLRSSILRPSAPYPAPTAGFCFLRWRGTCRWRIPRLACMRRSGPMPVAFSSRCACSSP